MFPVCEQIFCRKYDFFVEQLLIGLLFCYYNYSASQIEKEASYTIPS